MLYKGLGTGGEEVFSRICVCTRVRVYARVCMRVRAL